jgi:hypothetical protein
MATVLGIDSDFIFVGDATSGSDGDNVVDTISVSDAAQDNIETPVVEQINVGSVVTDSGNWLDVTIAVVRVADWVNDQDAFEQVVDTIEVVDVVTDTQVDLVVENIAVTELGDLAVVQTEAVIESVLVAERIFDSRFELVVDLINVADNSTGTGIVTEQTVEQVEVAGIIAELLDDNVDIVVDTFVVTDFAFTGPGVTSDVTADVILVRDRLYSRNFDALALLVNTETGAPALFDNFDFTSIVEHQGNLIATSAEGLFVIQNDANDVDYGNRKINCKLQTGFEDFGTDQRKRIRDLYMGYTGGLHELTVETYNGPSEVYSYEMREREADAPRNNRIRTGRGLNSRFWRFTIRNCGGGKSQIFDMKANVDVSKRRL